MRLEVVADDGKVVWEATVRSGRLVDVPDLAALHGRAIRVTTERGVVSALHLRR